jgi:hypothetical protein
LTIKLQTHDKYTFGEIQLVILKYIHRFKSALMSPANTIERALGLDGDVENAKELLIRRRPMFASPEFESKKNRLIYFLNPWRRTGRN